MLESYDEKSICVSISNTPQFVVDPHTSSAMWTCLLWQQTLLSPQWTLSQYCPHDKPLITIRGLGKSTNVQGLDVMRTLSTLLATLVAKSPINNIPALVRIMAWRRPGGKPLSEPMMASLPVTTRFQRILQYIYKLNLCIIGCCYMWVPGPSINMVPYDT